MKALLLATAGVIALGGAAMANGRHGGGHNGGGGGGQPDPTPTLGQHFAGALGLNWGDVVSNSSDNHRSSAGAAMSGSFNGDTAGIAQVNQNAGANSVQQNATAVAYIQGQNGDVRVTLAGAANDGSVWGSGNRSSNSHSGASGTIANSFGGFTGIANVNQNVGANSLQQNAAAVAAIEGCGECVPAELTLTVAAAGNVGSVYDNRARSSNSSAYVGMAGAFNGASGVMQVNQNAGANSLGQNSVAIGAVFHGGGSARPN